MSNHSKQIVDRLWSYCNVLLDDGLSYQDYLEQLTYLLFLKMAEERAEWSGERIVPEGWGWPSLLAKDGDGLPPLSWTGERLGFQAASCCCW